LLKVDSKNKEESPYEPESLEHGAMFLIAWN